jgi:serpin B
MRKEVGLVAAVAAPIALTALAGDAAAQVAQPSPRVAPLTDAYNASGQDLLGGLAGSSGNLVLSPYSIGSVMGMALSGARGDTEREMLAALKHSLGRQDIDAANAEALATLNGYDRSAVAPTCPPDMQLVGSRCRTAPMAGSRCMPPMQREGDDCMGGATFTPSARLLVANALMLPKPGTVGVDYARLLNDKYAAELFENAKLADVNAWVARKTEGKIKKIVEQKDEGVPGLVIINAVYFKSRWASPFDEKQTKTEAFHLSRRQQVQVAMMHQTHHYAVVARQGYRAIRLPYIMTSLAMIIVLPDDIDGLADVARRMDAKEQAALLAAMRAAAVDREIVLTLPRFHAESEFDLVDSFKAAGMKLAFDPARADFSGMTGKPPALDPVYIAIIKHRAVIDVAEESTEAAAVTIIAAPTGGGRPPLPGPPPEVFRVDHPFLFFVTDNATGAALFAGRVSRDFSLKD